MSREFGIYPEGKTPALWWGARGIIEKDYATRKYQLSLLPDRQSSEICDAEHKKEFVDCINNYIIPALENFVKKREMSRTEFSVNGVHCVADERGSGGYLYIGAWSEEGMEV